MCTFTRLASVIARVCADTVPEEEEVEEPAPVARSKGFWQRG